ncbi:ABC transporter ATP-binding protein [Albidovulum sp.]|uniref:ABC transporter ATP-binding protein n=1 Tax=Albidovulum sp. TaxID=1872424 RepID=UPI003529BD5A
MTEPLLSVRDLRVSFRTEEGPVIAVHGLSFDVGAGEVLSVVGESGSGKTVSLLSVLGLVDRRNTIVTGEVLFRGQPLLTLPERQMRRVRGGEIALISQDPMTAMTPVHTIGAQIAEQIRAHEPVSRAAARARAVDLLREVGISAPERAVDRFPHELSGGMRQRAVIAMALSCNPDLLIADEPTTALDTTVQAQVLDLLRQLRKLHNSSVVLITHDMGVVAEMADRVVVMYAGRVVESGPVADIFNDPWHPYTWGLLDSIPPLTGARPKRLVSIPGAPPLPGAAGQGCAFAPRCRAAMPQCLTPPTIRKGPGRMALCFLDAGLRDGARRQVRAPEQVAT